MLKNSKQQIKLTIHKTEIVSSMIQSFYLKMNANEITFITDKITEKFYDYNKSFIFDLQDSESTQIDFVAVTKSLMNWEFEIGKVTINLNLSNINEDSTEWFTLINDFNEDICKVKISFNCLINSSIKKNRFSDNDIKMKTRVNYSIDEGNLNRKEKNNVPKKANNTTDVYQKKFEKTDSSNLDETIVYDESSKSPDISNICSEFFSPKSHRDPENVYLNHTTVKQKTVVEDNYHNMSANNNININIDKLFEPSALNVSSNNFEFNMEKANDFIRKLKKKKVEMKEKEKKLLKEQEDLRVIKEKLRQRETLLARENKKLEMQVQQVEAEKLDYENQLRNKNLRMQRLDIESMKYENQRSLLNYDKEIFAMINNLINSYNFVDVYQNEIITIDNIGINSNLNSKKKSFDFTPPSEMKNKKSIKRYNTDQLLTVYKPNSKVNNNLNNITILESSDFSYVKGELKNYKGGQTKKDSANYSMIKEFNHLDISPDKNLCDIKELDETESIHLERKISHKNFYNNIHQTKIPVNSSLNIDINTSTSQKKTNYETHKILNSTLIQNNKSPLKTEISLAKNKELKSNNLNSPINGSLLQKNLETYVAIEKNKMMKNQQIEKRRISEDRKLKVDTDISKKKNMILAKINKENLSNSKKSSNEKSSNERKINLKNLSGNSNHISTNNSSINSNNTLQKQFASKANKKPKN